MAVLAASAALWLLIPPPPRSALRRLAPAPVAGRTRSGRASAVLLAGLALAAAALGGLALFGWVLAGAVALGTVAWLVRASRVARAVRRGQAETAEAATTLSLLLRSGQLPTTALTEAASDSPCLAPAVAAARLGGDVGRALAEAASRPGYAGLGSVAAAWRVSERTGAPIAGLLAQVAASLRKDREVADLVAAELSSARASGRIMAALPFVAVALGTVVGADPVGFLFGQWLGEVLFVGGILLACVGVVWTERLAAGRVGAGGSP